MQTTEEPTMTRTNRAMSEPPSIPPDHFAGVGNMVEPLDDLPQRGLDDMGSMAMLTACLISAGAVVLMLVGGYAHHVYTQGRIDRLQAALRALNTFTSCEAPAKVGDSTVITIRKTERDLATRCQVITNPNAPERALKGTTL
jgi:hypothetical protein